jgi:hypothetical protein
MKVMKVEKSVLTPKWQEIKAMFESNTNGSKEYGENFPIDGEFDELTQHFIGMLGAITLKQGFDTVVEGVKMDLWKERIWSVVENAGLLPNIAWKDELEIEEVNDTWEEVDNEFDYDIEKFESEAYGS